MSLILPVVFVLAGFVLLTKGADIMVDGAVALAARAGISPLVIGLTVVAFGTSLPELVVCLDAALSGAPGIAIGNVVGSNIANILLILGACGLIHAVRVSGRQVFIEVAIVIAASLAAIAAMAGGLVVWWQGALMLSALFAYLGFQYWQGRSQSGSSELDADVPEDAADQSIWMIWAMVLGGLIGVALGGRLLVDGAVDIARMLAVPETVIGLTMIALGTSLPELATAVAAALKRQTEVVLGNVLGSNIFNILGVLGATSLVTAVPVDAQVIALDMWVMLVVSVALVPVLLTKRDINRIEAGLFLACYCIYIGYQFA